MKRYLDEDYEFEVEVTGYLGGGVKSLKAYAATVKSLVISIHAQMVVQ